MAAAKSTGANTKKRARAAAGALLGEHSHRPHRPPRPAPLRPVPIADALLTLLGAASEASAVDRTLKVSTATHRTHSLYWQGNFWYRQLAIMRDDWFERLITAFDKVVREHQVLGIL